MFDYKNAGLYSSAFRAYRDNLILILICGTLFVVLEYVNVRFDNKTSYWMPIIVQIWFAYYVHRTILNGKADNLTDLSSTEKTFTSFLWRSLLLFLFLMLLIIPMTIFALIFKDFLGDETETFVSGMILLGFPLCGIFLSILGTTLPAAVDGADKSFRAAYQRSRGQILSTFWKYVYGPTLFTIQIIAASFGLQGLGTPTDVFSADNSFDPLGAVVSLILEYIGLFGTTLGVTILCKAYLHATPQTDIT